MSNSPHAPVMLEEAVGALAPADGEIHVDATFGAGGYSRAILKRADCTVYGFDRDPTAMTRAAGAADLKTDIAGERLVLINRPFADVETALGAIGVTAIDGIVFDLGVSSMQLDEAARGFSFMRDGPLSMRMDGGKPDASDLVNEADASDLAAIFRYYGEEKRAGRIARFIEEARAGAPILTTGRLAEIVLKASPARHDDRIHPATRVFQALRIFVNDELGQLALALEAAERILKPKGRLVVVTFHSLEDRIVKQFLTDRTGRARAPSRHAPIAAAGPAPSFDLVSKKPLAPGEAEIIANPRARSAKLRAAIRTSAPAITSPFYASPIKLTRSLSAWS